MDFDTQTKTLTVTLEEYCDILNSNKDKSKVNTEINGKLILMLQQRGNNITEKQKNWVLSKLNFINKQKTFLTNYTNKEKINELILKC